MPGLTMQCGMGCFLAKTDIESAFRIIPIHPGDYCLLGMCWEGQYYYDRCMPMSCSSPCKTFETFSTALEWIAKHVLGVPHMIKLLNDFLLVSTTLAGCQAQLAQFLALCNHFPIAPASTVGPFRVLSFAGIELDSVDMEARVPQDKLDKCLAFLWVRPAEEGDPEGDSVFDRSAEFCLFSPSNRPHERRKEAASVHSLDQGSQSWSGDFCTNSMAAHYLCIILGLILLPFASSLGALGYGAIFGTKYHWQWGLGACHQQSDLSGTVLMGFVHRLVLACLKFNILFRSRHVPGVHN